MAKVSKAIVDKDLRDRVFTMIANGDVELFEKVNDREDMTARELMQSEIDAYTAKQDAKAEKAQKKAEKIAKDKARREAESEAKTEGE